MLTIKDARGIVYLTNQYDANGRVSRQTLVDTGVWLYGYTLDAQGKVETMRLPELQMSYKRSVEAAPAAAGVAMSEADLKRYAGKYVMEAAPIEISIEIVGGKLKAVVPGQPVYTLIPLGSERFQIEGAPAGFFVNFEVAEGKVKRMTVEQGQGPSLKLLPKQ